ncbi:hypothetical protein BMS3Bbin06_01961 [bacterium BMS3Bbin06]|nr:hypothetical protein BMS3Abin08_01795 [bacterium BMS3Abin08]GBE35420.1 hypothetical protein BMS3Bbin06_01961 [bacterium BMS3Bbin06]
MITYIVIQSAIITPVTGSTVQFALPGVHAERNRTILLYVMAGMIVGLLPRLL